MHVVGSNIPEARDEHCLFVYWKKERVSHPKKNGALVMKGVEPSEFSHKTTSTQQVWALLPTHLAGFQQPSPGQTKPYPLQRHDLSNVHAIRLSNPNP